MLEITIRRTWKVNGVPTDPDQAMMLSDPTGQFGVKRVDTDAVIVTAGTEMEHEATGVYAYTFEADPNITYAVYMKVVFRGSIYYLPPYEVTTPAETTAQETVTCDALPVVEPGQAELDGCPIITKIRHVTVHKGVQAAVRWSLRYNDGREASLLDCFPAEEGSASGEDAIAAVKVRFAAFDERGPITIADGEVYDADAGVVQFTIPVAVANLAGLYRFEVGIYSANNILRFTDRGFLSVERGLFGDTQPQYRHGPPTINEIRMALRDTTVENRLNDAVEFTEDEIIHAITRPIAEWNETPPPIAVHTCGTFPYPEMWLKGIIGCLLQNAGFWYLRNKLPSSHGGLSVNDMEKDNAYFALGERYRNEWRTWMYHKKVELNAKAAFRSLGSSYGSFGRY